MALEVAGWHSLPTVTAVEIIVTRMLANAAQYDESLKDEADRMKPMTYAERVAWLSATPQSALSDEERAKAEDDATLAALGLPADLIRAQVAKKGAVPDG